MHKALALKLKLKRMNNGAIRYNRWFMEGKKDGMCGLCKGEGEVPRRYREAYCNGHAYGMLSREVA